MSYPPTIPPHPTSLYSHHSQRQDSSKPPVPPLPPGFHPESSLVSPTPERVMPNLPHDMARTLDDAAYGYPGPTPSPHPPRAASLYPNQYGGYPPPPHDPYYRASPAPPNGHLAPTAGYPGGFARPQSAFGAHPPPPPPPPPGRYGASPAPPPPPPGAYVPPPVHSYGQSPYSSPPQHQPYSPPQQPHHQHTLAGAMDNLSLSGPPRPMSSASYSPSRTPHVDPQAVTYAYAPPPGVGRGSPSSPEVTAPMPTKESLAAVHKTLPPAAGPAHIPFIRDVLFFVEHTYTANDSGTIIITDIPTRELAVTAATALAHILNVPPPHAAEAIYLRALFHATGCIPEKFEKSPRNAFRDFEASARAGWVKAWFKIGREYENTGDHTRAKDCFERGLKAGVESCYYRLGMAHLLGQLGLSPSPETAMQLLQEAAKRSSIESPHPAYVYGLLLLGEFTAAKVEERYYVPLIPQGSSPTAEARKHIERAAYLGFAPAQYKLGHAYEYAVPPFPFDPLLSVQYYSLASQQGESEADMALSKWFLCGADGAFEKDEGLAVTFADKAAKTGLHSAEFAMGYYAEVGIGQPKDLEEARKWYAKAVEHGNADAPARLSALSQAAPQSLSRTQHDTLANDKLVRRRTQARAQAVAAGRVSNANHEPTAAEKVKMEALKGAKQEVPSAAPVPATLPPLHNAPPRHASTMPAPPPQGPPPPPHGGPPPQQGRPFANAPRYTLSDTPSPPPAGAPGLQQHPSQSSYGRPAGRPPGRRHETVQHVGGPPAGTPPAPSQSAPPSGRPQPNGPATFAEMGFQVGKAEEKDCVIM